MNVIAKDIIDLIEKIAPEDSQVEWDNSGLQIGDRNLEINGVLLVLDITDKSVDYAINNGYNFLLSHHPLFFSDLKSIDFSTYKGNLIKKIIENNLFIYSAHTNLDASDRGVNFELANKIGLKNIQKFSEYIDGEEIGVIGDFPEKNFDELVENLKKLSKSNHLKIYGTVKENIEKVGVIGGSGSFGINLAKSLGADCLITGDVKHHDGQRAYEEDLIVIDLGHYYSEFPVLNFLKKYLSKELSNLKMEIFSDPVYFIEY